MKNKFLSTIPILCGFYLSILSCKALPYYTADVIVQNLMTAESIGKIYTTTVFPRNGVDYDNRNFVVVSPIALFGYHLKGDGIETLKIDLEADSNLDKDKALPSKEYSVISISWVGKETVSIAMWGKRLIQYTRTDEVDEYISQNGGTIEYFDDRQDILVDLEDIVLGALDITPNSTTLVSYYMKPYGEDNRVDYSDKLVNGNTQSKYVIKFPKDYTGDAFIADYNIEKDSEGWTATNNIPDYAASMIFSLIQVRVKKL